ncbi:hypothetical protein MKW92_051108 [Papaver armeniacum]|nr:hypothetical protein MKW92_051108 [Papaver armeniacum]
MFMCFTYFTMYGMMAVAMTPAPEFASITMALFLGLWNLFSGFLIPKPQIPIWWRWYYWASPVSWTLYGLVTSQVGDRTNELQIPGLSINPTVQSYLKENFGWEYGFLKWVVLAHVGFVLVFFFVFAYGIKKFNFQRR